MWLSKAIEKDKQTRDALRELERLAKKCEDATKLTDISRFFSTEMRWFRPSLLWYCLFVLGFGVVGVFRGLMFETFEGQEWLDLSLNVIIPVFVLAVTITSLARSFSESVKFADEYFNEVCRMELYCCLTLLTMLVTILSSVIANSKVISIVVIECCAGISLGATLSCITGIAFIIRETIRCAESSKAVQAATNYAARKLSYALVGKHYLTLWMTKYDEIIKDWCQHDLKAIRSPSQYICGVNFQDDNSIQKEIRLNFKIDIQDGAVDYNLRELKKLNDMLNENGSELFLYPHSFQKGRAILGTIQSPQKEKFEKFFKNVNQIAKKGCRFKRDRIHERNKRFWEEHFNKLESALKRAIRDNEIGQMYSYLDSLVWVIEAIEKARKDEVVRRANDMLDKCWDLIDLYRKSLRQILLDGKHLEHQDKASNFTNLLIESLRKQVEQILEKGDWATLKLITWLVPQMYMEYESCGIKTDSILRESRALFGSFYAWTDSLFEEHCGKVAEEDQVRMRIVLHEGATKWLLMANKKKDSDLVKSLYSATGKIAFGRKQICFKHKDLACQHLLLLGKMISRHLKDEGVVSDDVKSLVPEPYERALKIDFEELTSFYLEHQVPIESHREYLRLFVNYVPGIRSDPLTRMGSGQSWSMGLGGYEMALSFVYLGSFALRSGEEPVARAIDFISGHFENAIKEMKVKNKTGGFTLFYKGFDNFEKWVRDCSNMHRQQEAERIAESQIEPEVCQSYDRGFQEGLKESVPFIDYCVKKGYVEESDAAARKINWHMPKEWFLGRSPNDIVREGTSHGKEIGHDANTQTVRLLIDYEEEEADVEKDVGMRLIQNNEAREKAAKEVQKAVGWLKGTGCSTEQGMIILRGVGPDVLHLFNESEYKRAWKEKGMERGFEGYYYGYPVLYLWDVRGRPLCAAMDLRGWRGLNVRPELVNENQAGKVLEIRERRPEEIKKATEGDTDEIQAKGYCVVELELFWKMPEEKPKQKVFPYALPPSESTVKEN